jgi:phosphoglycolate phosphatase
MPRPTVLLFDIDGTLVTTSGVGRRSLELAFDALHGRPDACKLFRLDGMTDRKIIRQGLTAIGVDPTPAAIDAVLAKYLELLEVQVSRSDYKIHNGMLNAVNTARERQHIAVGLGTGNVKEGAKLKLDKVGLFSLFSFGGFGCDHEERVELIRQGAQRGAEQLRAPLSECRVVVIGDTPKDVEAALGIGAECVGVGTGHYTLGDLMAAGARRAFLDFTAEGALEAVLGDA